jgi:uncharacterized protein YgiM (DUF1202 family)
MKKFIVLTFGFLGWAFYEVSGGDEFEPTPVQTAAQASESAEETKSADPVSSSDQVILAKATTTDPAATQSEPRSPAPRAARASFANQKPVMRKPDAAELDAVDPAVLAAFTAPKEVAKDLADAADAKLNGTSTVADSELVDGGILAGQLQADLRTVTGNRVNMRNGPGTKYSIVARLTRGQEVEVLSNPGNGWLKLRVVENNRIGWMAEFLVTASAE